MADKGYGKHKGKGKGKGKSKGGRMDVQQFVPVPEVHHGLIIGKGGRNMEDLKTRCNVSIRNRKQLGGFNVVGEASDVYNCIQEINKKIESHSRQVQKGKGRSARGGTGKTCPLCKKEVNSPTVAIEHLCSAQHLGQIGEDLPQIGIEPRKISWLQLSEWLEQPWFADFHTKLGFPIDQLKEQLPIALQKVEAREKVSAEINEMEPDDTWLKI
eukprot:Skav230626  [mRNA]  locus=scaffold1673:143294:143932:+ [translate_table: standard]